MRFEDMKNNIPETPDFIHEMIKNEVDRQLQETKIIAIPKKRKRPTNWMSVCWLRRLWRWHKAELLR